MGERKTPRPRKSFSKLPQILDVPNLIAIQTESFEWFKNQGPQGDHRRHQPHRGLHGQLRRRVRRVPVPRAAALAQGVPGQGPDLRGARCSSPSASSTGRRARSREQNVFMGDFPMMTEQGTFIINGTERVIVTQLVRSPGAYVMAAKDPTKQVLVANLMPARGSWLEFEIDKRGAVSVRIDRKRKLPATVFLRALAGIDSSETRDEPGLLSKGTDEEILDALRRQPLHQGHPGEGLRPLGRGGSGRAVQEAAPRRAAHAGGQPQPAVEHLLRSQALRPHPGGPAQAERPPRASTPTSTCAPSPRPTSSPW